MEQEEMKHCPYCGEEILAVTKKCKHCGEWLETLPPTTDENNEAENVNVMFEQNEEEMEEEMEILSTREKVCRYIGWGFYVLATLDVILANSCDIDITGFKYSPILFYGIGYLISRYGGNVSDTDDEE